MRCQRSCGRKEGIPSTKPRDDKFDGHEQITHTDYSMARGGYAARSAPRGMQVHVRVHVHVRAVRLSRTTTARLSYGSAMYRV